MANSPRKVNNPFNARIKNPNWNPPSSTSEYRSKRKQITGDATQIRQVIHNMLQNAQDALAAQDDGEIGVITRRDGERAVLLFRDNGPGFPAAVLAHAVEPYFTTK